MTTNGLFSNYGSFRQSNISLFLSSLSKDGLQFFFRHLKTIFTVRNVVNEALIDELIMII